MCVSVRIFAHAHTRALTTRCTCTANMRACACFSNRWTLECVRACLHRVHVAVHTHTQKTVLNMSTSSTPSSSPRSQSPKETTMLCARVCVFSGGVRNSSEMCTRRRCGKDSDNMAQCMRLHVVAARRVMHFLCRVRQSDPRAKSAPSAYSRSENIALHCVCPVEQHRAGLQDIELSLPPRPTYANRSAVCGLHCLGTVFMSHACACLACCCGIHLVSMNDRIGKVRENGERP